MITAHDIATFVRIGFDLPEDRQLVSETRLRADLRITSRQAAKFFTTFESAYRVDLTPLRRDWSQFFGPPARGWSFYISPR